MNGIIILTENYTYEGNIVNKEPHGKGIFQYTNGDRYVGQCLFGKHDGFGTYYFAAGCKYTGYFSLGKMSGIGTAEDENYIYKGSWRNDKKHGIFHKTDKINYKTYKQIWNRGKRISNNEIQYIQPDALATIKENPMRKPKVFQTAYKGNEKKCMACMDRCTNATNTGCGHVVMCYECLEKCDKCPICRDPIKTILKLYLS